MLAQIKQEIAQIESLYKRWLVGGNTVSITTHCVPQSWQLNCKELSQAELRRHALIWASQQRSWMLSHSAPQQLVEKSALPRLTLPVIAQPHRTRFVSCLNLLEKQGVSISFLLNLLTERGVSVHPADWLPNKAEELPSEYFPWLFWSANYTQDQGSTRLTGLTSTNWTEFLPTHRLVILRKMRSEDPAQALALIQQCISNETAQQRLKIINILAINLSENDKSYLESLLNERSQKVALLAKHLLSRIGPNHALKDSKEQIQQAAELADWYEVKTVGLLRKSKVIQPKSLKSKKQQSLRSEWLEHISLTALAQALDIDLQTLITGWQFNKNRQFDNHAFISNAAQSLPNEMIYGLLNSLLECLPECFELIFYILPRLSKELRIKVMMTLLSHKKSEFHFYNCLNFIERPCTHIEWQQLKNTQAWLVLLADIREQLKDNSYLESQHSIREISALGLMVDEHCAQQILNSLLELGVMTTDPLLDVLKLNIQLSQTTTDQI